MSIQIGGQAVMEGVMMRYQDTYAVAVRDSQGQIHRQIDRYTSVAAQYSWSRFPIIRGAFALVDSMILGMKCLSYSSSFFLEEEETEEVSSKRDWQQKISIILAIGVALSFFVILPFGVANLLGRWNLPFWGRNIVEGILRLGFFLSYIIGISRIAEIHRVFCYHGAEHKCISCLEGGLPLEIANVKKSSRYHKRCGTSFLLLTVLISILVFMFFNMPNPFLRLGFRILGIPLVGGLAYEMVRLAGRSNHWFFRLISIPGIYLQQLTTKEPDEDMIEVAIWAVEGVLDWRKYLEQEGYPDY